MCLCGLNKIDESLVLCLLDRNLNAKVFKDGGHICMGFVGSKSIGFAQFLFMPHLSKFRLNKI